MIVVTGDDLEERQALQSYLEWKFEIKDLGPLNYFLGIEVARLKDDIFLSQKKYVHDLLHVTGMLASQPVDMSFEEGLKLWSDPDQPGCEKKRHQQLVGRLMYLAHMRQVSAYVLSVLSQFLGDPKQHMDTLMQTLWYVKSAPHKECIVLKEWSVGGWSVYICQLGKMDWS